MTDEKLAEIKARVHSHQRSADEASFIMKMDARALLIEVERLRGLLDALDRQTRFERELRDRREAALLEIVRAVADECTVAMWPAINGGNDTHEPWCAACLCIQTDDTFIHDEDCPVTKARALLADDAEAPQTT